MIDIIEKIRNLRKLSTSSNPHEAATAAALADQLIQKHRIEETELELGAGVAAELGEDPTPIHQWAGRKKKWEAVLVHTLCGHYDVASYNRRTGSGVRAMAVGHPSDIRLAMPFWSSADEKSFTCCLKTPIGGGATTGQLGGLLAIRKGWE
jgi:hypothetical protein